MTKKLKIALLSSYTIKNVVPSLQETLQRHDLDSEIRLGEYNQFNQELRDPHFWYWNPNMVIIALSTETFLPTILEKSFVDWEQARKLFLDKLGLLFGSLQRVPTNTKVILTTFDTPPHSPYGFLDFQRDDGLTALVREVNDELRRFARAHSNILLLDFDRLLSLVGKDRATDEKMFYLGKILLSSTAAKRFGVEVGNLIAASLGRVKKCLVVDLDNTLWYGVVGEDGVDGIQFSDTTMGEIYQDVQRALALLKKTGVLLAIVSKNNEEDVLPVFEKKGMVLRKDDFVAMRINWKPKSENIKAIAEELNLGLDSFVFLDDNPAERLEVASRLPMVEIIDFPKDVARLPKLLLTHPAFKKVELTEEDKKRHEMYLQEKKRKALQVKGGDYLSELGIKIRVSFNDLSSLERITQLINKTNQFNLRTQRYTKEEVEHFIRSDDYLVSSVRVWDKFGELGLTGVLILDLRAEPAFIDTFLLSCRVLGRDIEKQFFLETMKRAGITYVRGEYIPTPKNRLVADLYERLSFELVGEKNGVKQYELRLPPKVTPVQWIEVVDDEVTE